MQGFFSLPFFFFSFPSCKALHNCTANLRINSEESWNLWQREISPHLRKLPLREYINGKLNITKDATGHEFKTKRPSLA